MAVAMAVEVCSTVGDLMVMEDSMGGSKKPGESEDMNKNKSSRS
jgi:hypothetical protein